MTCSRTENAELFGLAMGGYGLFGVLVDLVVEMVPNRLLTPTFAVMPAAAFAPALAAAVARDARLRMAYGRLSVARAGFFDEAILVTYAEAEHPPQVLPAAAAQGRSRPSRGRSTAPRSAASSASAPAGSPRPGSTRPLIPASPPATA